MLCKDIYPVHCNYHTENTKNLLRKSAEFLMLKLPIIWFYEDTLNESQLILCVQRDGRWKEHNRRSGLLRRHLRCVNNYKTTVPILLFIICITENFWLLYWFIDNAPVQCQQLIVINGPQHFKFLSNNFDNCVSIYTTKCVNSCVGIWTWSNQRTSPRHFECSV